VLAHLQGKASELDHIVLVFATGIAAGRSNRLDGRRCVGRGAGLRPDLRRRNSVDRDDSCCLLDKLPRKRILTMPVKGKPWPQSGSGCWLAPFPCRTYTIFSKRARRDGRLSTSCTKNVRRFLGSKSKVNRAMQQTLRKRPSCLASTTTVSRWSSRTSCSRDSGSCSVWAVHWWMAGRLALSGRCFTNVSTRGSGSSGVEPGEERLGKAWLSQRSRQSRRDRRGSAEAITRYTDSQNAVREEDFPGADLRLSHDGSSDG